MSLDKTTLAKVARLARLRLNDAEQDEYAKQVSGIMHWIDQLNEVDTTGIEPLASVSAIQLVLRPDIANDGGIASQIVANAPESVENFFVVPKVVE